MKKDDYNTPAYSMHLNHDFRSLFEMTIVMQRDMWHDQAPL